MIAFSVWGGPFGTCSATVAGGALTVHTGDAEHRFGPGEVDGLMVLNSLGALAIEPTHHVAASLRGAGALLFTATDTELDRIGRALFGNYQLHDAPEKVLLPIGVRDGDI